MILCPRQNFATKLTFFAENSSFFYLELFNSLATYRISNFLRSSSCHVTSPRNTIKNPGFSISPVRKIRVSLGPRLLPRFSLSHQNKFVFPAKLDSPLRTLISPLSGNDKSSNKSKFFLAIARNGFRAAVRVPFITINISAV